MNRMTKHIALFLAFSCLLSVFVFGASKKVEAAEVETYIGDMTISISGIDWTDSNNTQNHLMVIKPGSALNGSYFDRIYAVYDSSKGGYVVTEKAGTHWSYSRTVATGAIGLAISYQPLTTRGAAFTRENWKIWQQIRVGDILTFSNVDLTTGEITTSGTFGSDDFVSTAKVHVTTVRDDAAATTGYTGKTIVALGDSVTAGGRWTEEVEANLNTRIVNVGTPGALTDNGLTYFPTQVTPNNPDIVFIKYAINDTAQYTIAESNVTKFKENLRTLCDMALDIGALPILITTNKIQLTDSSKYEVVGGLYNFYPRFISAIKEIAEEYDTYCIDLYNEVWADLTAADYLMDSVHPNKTAYLLEADYIIEFLTNNEEGIIAKVNAVSGKVQGLPEATTNYALEANGGSYMYPTTAYPGGASYYTTAYYGDNSNKGGEYFSGKLNDDVLPADSIPNSSNTNWAVYFSGVTTPKIYFKLSDSVYLNSIKLYTRNGTASGINYKGATINSVSLSDDGSTYTVTSAYTSKTTASGTLNTVIKLSFDEAVKARYVCITLDTTTDRTAVGEVQIWGDTVLFGVEDDPFELVDGSVYTLGDGYLTLPGADKTASEVAAQFKCAVTVTDAAGNAVSSDTAVGTGFTVTKTDGTVTESAAVVLPGDLDGDTSVTTTDYMLIKQKILNGVDVDDCYSRAADCVSDGAVTTADMMLLRNIISCK